MKILVAVIAATVSLLELSAAGLTAEKTAAPAKAPAAVQPAADPDKLIPMRSRADAIDTTARTFTTKRKDGVEVKNVITDATEIKQGERAAKLEDIKVGDYVCGSRRKVSPTEYTVVKITKFGPKAAKKETAAAPTAK